MDDPFLLFVAAGYVFAALVLLVSLVLSVVRLFSPKPGQRLRSRIWDLVKCCLACLLFAGLTAAFFLPSGASQRGEREGACGE